VHRLHFAGTQSRMTLCGLRGNKVPVSGERERERERERAQQIDRVPVQYRTVHDLIFTPFLRNLMKGGER